MNEKEFFLLLRKFKNNDLVLSTHLRNKNSSLKINSFEA